MLYIVPTAIGNLEDMTYRAVRILKEVDCILAEDTRTSKPLLQHYGIETPMRSHHAHNEHHIVGQLVEELKAGKPMALISDAGTPAISDPGFLLVRACVEAGVEISCLPGATAFVPALVCSGLPCDKFHYEGFLPHKKGRQTRLEYISDLTHTVVLYESPHRLVKCLEQLQEHCGNERQVVVCREISKKFEDFIRGSIEEVLNYFAENPSKIKGEIVIVLEGMDAKQKKREAKQKAKKQKFQEK
jgi:16S rRNA (cytidine1402-2'-O)-methyltransferase